MKPATLIGIVMIIAGAAGLVLGKFSYKEETTVFKLGDLEATAQETKNVPLTYAGIGLLAAGVVLIVVGSTRR